MQIFSIPIQFPRGSAWDWRFSSTHRGKKQQGPGSDVWTGRLPLGGARYSVCKHDLGFSADEKSVLIVDAKLARWRVPLKGWHLLFHWQITQDGADDIPGCVIEGGMPQIPGS